MKKLLLLGASGSIGTQTVEVLRNLRGTEFEYALSGFSVHTDIDFAERMIDEFSPDVVSVSDPEAASLLKSRLSDGTKVSVLSGREGLLELCRNIKCDLCVNGIVGIAGLEPTMAVLSRGIDVALANKETIVTAGEIVMQTARDHSCRILPLDSEHSAVFQCLQGGEKALRRIILTASGGPFFGMDRRKLRNIKKEDALKHPSWKMGPKITIDCATLMNKGLEVIEAVRLFSVPEEKVEVVVHRESVIHSMIEYEDFSVIAQMGLPDMRVPIQYGLTYPCRMVSPAAPLDLAALSKMTFYQPDTETFKALSLARQALRTGGTAPTVLNAANEVAVSAFLRDEIGFLQIADFVEKVLDRTEILSRPSLEEILQTDRRIRQETV